MEGSVHVTAKNKQRNNNKKAIIVVVTTTTIKTDHCCFIFYILSFRKCDMNMAREQWVGRFEVAENDYPIVFNFFSIYITCFSIFITKQMNGHFRK